MSASAKLYWLKRPWYCSVVSMYSARGAPAVSPISGLTSLCLAAASWRSRPSMCSNGFCAGGSTVRGGAWSGLALRRTRASSADSPGSCRRLSFRRGLGTCSAASFCSAACCASLRSDRSSLARKELKKFLTCACVTFLGRQSPKKTY